jgi:hypothetical protein
MAKKKMVKIFMYEMEQFREMKEGKKLKGPGPSR